MSSFPNPISRPAILTLALALTLVLAAACAQPVPPPAPATTLAATATVVAEQPASPTSEPPAATPTPVPPPTPAPSPTPSGPIPIVFSANIPAAEIARLRDAVAMAASDETVRAIEEVGVISDAVNTFLYQPWTDDADAVLAERVFAVVAPFTTVQDDITLAELQARWSGEEQPLFVSEEAAVALGPVFESLPAAIVPAGEIAGKLAETPGSLGILPFEQLNPTLKVLAVDGINPLSNQLDLAAYPLAVRLVIDGPDAEALAPLFADALPHTNRDASRLTTLIMTGVTAMSRGTAEKMEEKGYTYPAEVISATLSAADITHVSNEVPFIDGCKVDNSYMNLVLCSDYPYWQALEAIGTDIVGLSGNHINDFNGARESLAFYRDRKIPIYGAGLNEEEACEPLLWEDHGNRFAFIAALAWWPDSAWATEGEPGACYFYDNYDRILADIERLKKEVDVVAVELQYHETYNPWPIDEQVEEFRALRQAGADIVTGVQSHVPQAWEPDAAGMIVYGLGNLFFDQMQDWTTRTGLIARHTLYDGRLISSEILTTVLEDFAQPRWATPNERAGILESIFEASPNQRIPPAPAAPETPAPAVEPIAAADGGQPGLAAPAPAEQPQDHYWLARLFAPEAQQLAAPTYPFGGTAGGRYRVHHGNDTSNPLGTPLLAVAPGTVIHAGPDTSEPLLGPYPDFFGNTVVLQLDQMWQERPVYVLYGHLNEVSVALGQHVEPGEQVGTVGMTGIAVGPHLHLEVRLDAPTYDNSYNAGLWVQPLFGTGTVAGRVVTPDGRAWHEARVFLYRLDGGRRLRQIIPTYTDDPGLKPDPEWAENFLLADVPAGDYELSLKLNEHVYKKYVTVTSGATAFAEFVVEE